MKKNLSFRLVFFAFIFLANTVPSSAYTITQWTAGSGSTSWTDSGNWSNGAPINDTTSSVVKLDGSVTTYMPVYTSSINIYGIDFETAGWTVGNSMLGIGASGVISKGSGTNTLYAPVYFKTNQTISIESANTLVMTSTVSLGGYTIVVDGGGTLQLTRNAGSAFATTSAGTLQLNNATLLISGTSGGSIPSGSTLALGGDNTIISVITNKTFSVDGSFNMGSHTFTKSGGGTMLVTGSISNPGSVVIDDGEFKIDTTSGSRSLSNVTGSYSFSSFTVTGGNTLTLTSSLNNPGTTTVSSGILSLSGTSNSTVSGVIDGSGSIQLNTTGTVTFSGSSSNTFNGNISVLAGTLVLNKSGGATALAGNATVTGGTLRLASSEQISNTSSLALGAGGTMQVNGQSETLGTLTISGASTIDMSGTSTLVFANSSGMTWSGTLTISNWDGTDSIRFGTDISGLTSSQLSMISITGYNNIQLDSSGYLTALAIPEPSASFLLLSSLALLTLVAKLRVKFAI